MTFEENTNSDVSLKSPNEGAHMDVLTSSSPPYAVEATAPEENVESDRYLWGKY